MHNREQAQDVVQDAFMYLLRKFPGFELTSQMKTFLYPVVRHCALACIRKEHREKQQPGGALEFPVISGDANTELLIELHRAVETLDAGHREVLILRFADDLSLSEIAAAMEIPLGTVKSRLHHALNDLRQNPRIRALIEDDSGENSSQDS